MQCTISPSLDLVHQPSAPQTGHLSRFVQRNQRLIFRTFRGNSERTNPKGNSQNAIGHTRRNALWVSHFLPQQSELPNRESALLRTRLGECRAAFSCQSEAVS